uniref:MPN domain-containing protein n=2 Tax=Panagrolaimus sp. JU765 TaxID=591449 RepID=A0AC34R922_9BILA
MLSFLRTLTAGRPTARDNPLHPDTAETVHISSLALLKMLRHARSGVPMEVMGLMLGEFVDDYTINVVDVFAMPQSGTGVSVEAIDPVYEAKMLDILKKTSRTEMVVGWYHSHPGFGCWLSSVDVETQRNFEALSPRAVAVVVDPIQSVRGKVVIDAFRSIPTMNLGGVKLAPTAEARQTTSNLGHLVRPSIVAAVHGLGFRYYSLPILFRLGSKEAKMLQTRQTTSNLGHLVRPSIVAAVHGLGFRYYSLPILFRLGSKEAKMLQSVNKQNWAVGLHTSIYKEHNKENENLALELKKMTKIFTKDIAVKQNLTKKEIELQKVGRLDPKRRMEELSKDLLQRNIVQTLCGI